VETLRAWRISADPDACIPPIRDVEDLEEKAIVSEKYGPERMCSGPYFLLKGTAKDKKGTSQVF